MDKSAASVFEAVQTLHMNKTGAAQDVPEHVVSAYDFLMSRVKEWRPPLKFTQVYDTVVLALVHLVLHEWHDDIKDLRRTLYQQGEQPEE